MIKAIAREPTSSYESTSSPRQLRFGIRVTAGGARAFIFNYRSLAGRERRMTIGGYPEWSVKAAREKAKALRRDVDDGYDPLGERIAEREASTVNDLIARWRTDHAPRKRERSRNEDESLISAVDRTRARQSEARRYPPLRYRPVTPQSH